MPFTYRSLMWFELSLYADHLKRLSDTDRYMRFEAVTTDARIDRYVAEIDRRSVVIGAFDGEGTLRGAAHVAREGGTADLGLAVEAPFRGMGVGSRLLDEAIAAARLRGARALSALCLARNGWMTRQLRKRGFDLTREGECMLAQRDLRPANPRLLAAAIMRDSIGWMGGIGLAAFGAAEGVLAAARRRRALPAA